MQGTYGSSFYCPTVIMWLLILLAITLAYVVADGWMRSHADGGHGMTVALRHVRPSTVLWVLPFVGALVFLDVWCAHGLYSGGQDDISNSCMAIFAAAALTLPRNRVAETCTRWSANNGSRHPKKIEVRRRTRVLHVLVTVILLALCTEFALLSVEVPWNASYRAIAFRYAAVETVIIALVLLALYFVGQRRGVGVAVGVVTMLVIGIANYFVFLFKDAAITPADLMALGTAAEVSGSYVYEIDSAVVQAIAYACIGIACAAYILPVAPANIDAPILRRRPVCCAAAAALCLIALGCFVTIPQYGSDFGVYLNHWDAMRSSSAQGFWPCFIKELQALKVPIPEGYTEETAKEAEGELAEKYDANAGDSRIEAEAQFNETQPSVVIIMNESYSDLSVYQDIANAGYAGTKYVNTGLTDALAKGDCYVSIFGGGTCNTEFEVLTGVNLHYIGEYKYPYTQVSFSNVACMPRTFRSLGYDTTAIHPNLGSNWNRTTVYNQMGFDTFYDVDAFKDAETYHGNVSDAATYDKTLAVLEGSDNPQFVLDVTMQNHSPYTTGAIPVKDRTRYSTADSASANDSQLNEYIDCVNESDEALGEFIDELRDLDRPVVVLFFGDHQPSLASEYNDASNADDSDVVHAERQFHTEYFIWANYDVAGNSQTSEVRDESASALGDVLMDLVGAPLTDFQKATLVSRAAMPVLNVDGYQDANGTWNAFDTNGNATGDAAETESLLAYVTYLEYGSVVN